MALAGGLWTAIHSALGHSIPPHSVHKEAFGTCYKTVATWCKLPNKLTLSRTTPMADTQPCSSWAKRLLLFFPGVFLTALKAYHTLPLTSLFVWSVRVIKFPSGFPTENLAKRGGTYLWQPTKGKIPTFFLLLLLKGLIWSSWDTKFTSGIRSWEKKKRRELKTTLHQRQWSNSCSLFGLDCSINTHFQLLWHWTLYLQMC